MQKVVQERADAAFAEFPEFEGYGYAIRLPANDILMREIAPLLGFRKSALEAGKDLAKSPVGQKIAGNTPQFTMSKDPNGKSRFRSHVMTWMKVT